MERSPKISVIVSFTMLKLICTIVWVVCQSTIYGH
jgi:hypothetical protein